GGAATFADALRRRIGQQLISIEETEVAVTLSAGVAVMRPGDGLAFDELLARAEEALASARSAGGNRIALDRMHGLARLDRPLPTPDAEAEDGA
ncbi:MAG: GGDEF domain-containing protein, partial [Candidatus Limnocylindria bacterium]